MIMYWLRENWFKVCVVILLAIFISVYSWNIWFDNQPKTFKQLLQERIMEYNQERH